MGVERGLVTPWYQLEPRTPEENLKMPPFGGFLISYCFCLLKLNIENQFQYCMPIADGRLWPEDDME